MILKVILGQRKERYEGEYGLEALGGCTEHEYDTNPDYLRGKLEEVKFNYGNEFSVIKVVDVILDNDALDSIFRPKNTIVGSVKEVL